MKGVLSRHPFSCQSQTFFKADSGLYPVKRASRFGKVLSPIWLGNGFDKDYYG